MYLVQVAVMSDCASKLGKSRGIPNGNANNGIGFGGVGIEDWGLWSVDCGLALTSTPAATAHLQNLWPPFPLCVVVVPCVLAMICQNAQKPSRRKKNITLAENSEYKMLL